MLCHLVRRHCPRSPYSHISPNPAASKYLLWQMALSYSPLVSISPTQPRQGRGGWKGSAEFTVYKCGPCTVGSQQQVDSQLQGRFQDEVISDPGPWTFVPEQKWQLWPSITVVHISLHLHLLYRWSIWLSPCCVQGTEVSSVVGYKVA